MSKLEQPGPLQVERLPDGRRKLLREFKYTVGKEPFCVPIDFEMNYSSVPWGFRWLVHWTRVDIAGVVHDYLYSEHKLDYPRLRADWIWFRIALSGCRRAFPHQAIVGLLALLIFGWMFKATGPGCSLRTKIITGLVEVPLVVVVVWQCLENWRCIDLLRDWLLCCSVG